MAISKIGTVLTTQCVITQYKNIFNCNTSESKTFFCWKGYMQQGVFFHLFYTKIEFR